MYPQHIKLPVIIIFILIFGFIACNKDDDKVVKEPKDPEKATAVAVDRFSDSAAVLMKRSQYPELPVANAPINFDEGVFITQSLGPGGETVKYYNFDVQGLTPAPVYVFFYKSSHEKVSGQMNILDVIPGEPGYNDFWQMVEVLVPDDYVANTAASFKNIVEEGYELNTTDYLINCPVVPYGSTANLRYRSG